MDRAGLFDFPADANCLHCFFFLAVVARRRMASKSCTPLVSIAFVAESVRPMHVDKEATHQGFIPEGRAGQLFASLPAYLNLLSLRALR